MFYNKFNSFLKFILGFTILINVILVSFCLKNYLDREHGKYTVQQHIESFSKFSPSHCSIYCDKHGCKHNHKLEKYHYLVKVIDIPMENWIQYRNESFYLYLIIFFFIYTSYYIYLK